MGWVRFFVEWKFAEGLSELKRAKELSPANPTANDLLARVTVYLGRIDGAERQARQAVELDPLSFKAQGIWLAFFSVGGKLDEADAAARKAAELQPAAAGNHRYQVLVAISAAMVKRRCGKRNWSPMKDIAVTSSRLPTTCAAIARLQTRL